MTEQDEKDLRELQAEIGAADRSVWQPEVVAGAFRDRAPGTPFVFRMQTWINLDAVRSPFLLGRLPEAETALEDFDAAFAAFGWWEAAARGCDADDLILLGRRMLDAVVHGFSTQIALRAPEGSQSAGADHGMGQWLPILACLTGQMGWRLADALDAPVAQVLALIAAHRCNTGWSVAGEPYALRGVAEEAAQDG